MSHRIIPRPEWGAAHANGLHDRDPVDLEVWLHHSVTVAPDLVAPYDDDHAAVRAIDRIGQTRFRSGIPYTFAITPAGLIFEGHSIGRVGAHTQGHNTRGAGIVLVGNYDTATPPQAMLDALAWLLVHGVSRGWWKRPYLNGGHRDTKPTACPGKNAYALIKRVNAAAGTLAAGGARPPAPAPAKPKPKPKPAAKGPLVLGSKGARVTALQRRLKTGYPLYAKHLVTDGVYGPLTRNVVREFQRRAGLVVDGVAGAKTHAALGLTY